MISIQFFIYIYFVVHENSIRILKNRSTAHKLNLERDQHRLDYCFSLGTILTGLNELNWDPIEFNLDSHCNLLNC